VLPALLITLLIVLAVLAWLTRGWWGRRRLDGQIARARTTLADERQRLEQEFLQQAAADGKPRGLKWVGCEFHNPLILALDRSTDEPVALIGVTIRFEAIPGGGMEDVEAVGNLRYATAVLVYRNEHWTSDGRVVFNLGPQETLEKYANSLTPLAQ
jgi:hypothetical protein